jgi:hypothetical protein
MHRAFLPSWPFINLRGLNMKITLPRVPTRNPLVRPSRQRHAGAHGLTGGAVRQRNSRELRRELQRISQKQRPPSP